MPNPFASGPSFEALRSAALAGATQAGVEIPEGEAGEGQMTDFELPGLDWTEDVCPFPLREADVAAIAARTSEILAHRHILLPDADTLIRRCVSALLLGNLVLQGPPGTGKTSLARALMEAFNVVPTETTATSEWSPFHVVGGFRPASNGGLAATHGEVVSSALACAEQVLSQRPENDPADLHPDQPQAVWLFIDEFNRADIDKAIGSLYTLLSSCDAQHLMETPIDLWFEDVETRRRLWVPARFRIIAAMNDLDTSFVNPISQGLSRRFNFVTVGIPGPPAGEGLSGELTAAITSAHAWLTSTYGGSMTVEPLDAVRSSLEPTLLTLQALLEQLRRPEGTAGWAIGTAQVVDVLRYVLIAQQNEGSDGLATLDTAIADRLVPQMSQIDDQQHQIFRQAFEGHQLGMAAAALQHLLDPHSV